MGGKSQGSSLGWGRPTSAHTPAGSSKSQPPPSHRRRSGDLPAPRRTTRPSAAALISTAGTQPRPHAPAEDGDHWTGPAAPNPRARGAHSAPGRGAVAPASQAPPCPAGIPGPAPHGPPLWRVPRSPRFPYLSFLLRSSGLGSGRLSRSCLAPVPALPVFPCVFTFQQRKSAFLLRTRAVPLRLRRR